MEAMVNVGALVNFTDVHGTTPLMDVIRCKQQERSKDTYVALSNMGKVSETRNDGKIG